MALPRSLSAVLVLALLSSALAEETGFIFQNYVNRLTGHTSKLANYDGYYNRQHVACFEETQLSHCALRDVYGAQFTLQSDFTCCDGLHEGWSGFGISGGQRMSVGNCVWNINSYLSGPVELIYEQLYRVGEVMALCELSSEGHKCGGPECDELKLSLQGHMYFTYAQSKQPAFVHTVGNDVLGGQGDGGSGIRSCCLLDLFDFFQFIGLNIDNGQCNSCDTCDAVCGCNGGGTGILPICDFCCGSACRKVGDRRSSNNTAPARSPGRTPQTNLQRWWQARKQNQPKSAARVENNRDNGQSATIHYGVAQVISGTAQVVSVNSRQERVEEVGLFEYVLDWQTIDAKRRNEGSTGAYDFPWIDRPGAFKLAWREEEANNLQA